MAYSAYELEAQMRDVFTQDPLVLGTPKLVSSEAYYINPSGFSTLRIRKDPSKLVSYHFNTGADIQFALAGFGPLDWKAGAIFVFLIPGESESYLMIAPGHKMLGDISAERLSKTGVATVDTHLPDRGLIEYLQTAEVQGAMMELAVVIMVWDV